MRKVFILHRKYLNYHYLNLFVSKDDNLPVVIDEKGTISGEDTWMTIYDMEKILSFFPGKTVEDFEEGLIEIKDLCPELQKSLGRRKIFSEIMNNVSETLRLFPPMILTEIKDLRISLSGGDLSGVINWEDGENDSIV